MTENQDLLLLCSAIVALLACLVGMLRSRRLKEELLELKRDLSQITRGQQPLANMNYHSPEVSSLKQSLFALVERIKKLEHTKGRLDEVLSFSSEIIGSGDQAQATASKITQLLESQIKPELVAVAVLLKSSEHAPLELISMRGLPQKRMEEVLCIAAESLLHKNQGSQKESQWGYIFPEKNSLFDFSSFGIGLSLVVPLSMHGIINGALWLGFKSGTATLNEQRKSFVKAMADHAAATLYAASKAQAREQERAGERDFLLGVSHDLRAPGSSALYALSDVLSGECGPLSTDQHLRLTLVKDSLLEQLSLLQDVLDFAKHQRGVLSAQKIAFDALPLIRTAIAKYQELALQHGLELRFDEDTQAAAKLASQYVYADRRQVERILANFITNAIKYSPAGLISIQIIAQSDALELVVLDRGPGIPAEQQNLLFNQFQRLQTGAATEGFGLGLALSRVLAELNSGYVFYRSRAGGGSIFGVGLKYAPAGEIKNSEARFERVLVLDDEPEVCRATMRLLQSRVGQLIPSSTISEAREVLNTLAIDLLVTDLHVGTEKVTILLDEIKNSARKIPIIVLTGSSNPTDLKDLQATFGAHVLEKPITREELLNTLSALPR
ncbi:hybrid sensor histidine kinase/response regulator [bacterium]|nr:hybrid sensor histidine kinase/response regulator [bacterium]